MQPNPARVLTRLTSRLSSDFWPRTEQARANAAARGYLPDPQIGWVYADTLQVIVETYGGALYRHALQDLQRGDPGAPSIHEAFALPALTHWRLTRGMYEFDDTLREMLAETELDELPADAIRNMPEYAPYITLNGYQFRGEALHGCWVTRVVAEGEESSLQVVLHYQRDKVWTLSFVIRERITIDQMVEAAFAASLEVATRAGNKLASQEEDIAASKRLVRYILSLVLYLCSEEPDITGLVTPVRSTQRRGKVMIVKPERDNILQVGYRLGGKIRMWQELQQQAQPATSGMGLTKSPHLRRAHWHLYWTGKGRIIPRVKWVMPVAVNVKNFDEIATHVRPVIDDPADAR